MNAESIENEASRWLAAHDAADGSFELAAFERWLDADIRHRVAFLRLESSWRRAGRLRELQPLDRDADPDLLRPTPRRWHALAASFLVVVLIGTGLWYRHEHSGWESYETPVGGRERIVLDDGSVVDLNTNSAVRVRLGNDRREVQLVRGEGRFQVAHEPSRPFVVTAAGAAVSAIGTQFSVRVRDHAHVDVLVAEGRVAIASARVPPSPPVNAGEVATVLPDRMSVRVVEPRALERRLAWTSGRLEFRGETLREAVDEFNRYNQRQLRLGDPSLASLRIGGNFNATDPDGFAAALGSTLRLGVAVDVDSGGDALVIWPR